MIVQQAGVPITVSGSATLSLVACTLLGFYVNSTSSGTIVIKDGGQSAGTAISGTITPSAGWNCFPAACVSGLSVTIGPTINVTFFVGG